MREIILDTETTGLEPSQGHRMVEIGCVEMLHKTRTGRSFHSYINPEREVPYEAERIHGIKTEFLLDKPLFEEIAEKLIEFIGDATLVIHNAQFDMKFLNYQLEKAGKPIFPLEKVIDTLAIARKKYPGAANNLDALCRRFNIDLSARTKHGALLDAELLAEIYIELNGGKQVALEFAVHKQEKLAATKIEARKFNILELAPSEEELSSHGILISNIKQNLWENA